MKNARVVLTKTSVDAAAPAEKRYHVWDRELPGFGLRIEPSGIKSFVAKYRTNGGGRSASQRMATIGRLGKLTAEQARKEAKRMLAAAVAGADPAGDLQAKRRELKMSALVDLYEQEGCVVQRGKRQGEAMKDRTQAYTIARLRHHVVPLLGQRRVSEINAGDIERFVADVAAGKTARDEVVGPRKRIIVRGGAGAARKVVRDLSAVFSFAVRREIVTRNPCETAAVRKTDNQRERFLTLDEVARLGTALDELEKGGANPKAVTIAKLWALTGCRRNEIAGLKWHEVDFEEGILRLATSKTGKSIRPLGAVALALLRGVTKNEDSDFVFPGERGEGYYQGTKSVWTRAIKKAALPGVTPHTLRHTMGSTATSSGEALALTGAILGHANSRSTAIYAHVHADASKRAANRVSKKIAAALARKPSGEIARQQAHGNAGSDGDLINALVQRLADNGPEAARLRTALVQTIAETLTIAG